MCYDWRVMPKRKKALRVVHGEIKTPPFSTLARIEAGKLLGRVQDGESLSLPESRPMPSIGNNVHELRINDEHETWRIIYRIDTDAILVAEVFSKKTPQTPQQVINSCKARFKRYDQL